MRNFAWFHSRGQTALLVALMALALVAFVALAVDGGNVYATRREAQSAADGAAIAGTWVMVDYSGSSPAADILRAANNYAQKNGVADTDGNPDNPINDNLLAYYIYFDGSRVPLEGVGDWELHAGPNVIPSGARGIEVVTTVTRTTYFARVVGWPVVQARANAAARYQPDGGILPIAVNEYWLGSEGHCPYAHCGEPYSFVRNPSKLPPFTEDPPGSDKWVRNDTCLDPYNENVCQGPYEGYGENFGKAFAMLGGDAKPNYGSMQPRSAVELDYRYNAIVNGGSWFYLIGNDQFVASDPIADGQGKDAMAEVIASGGYSKIPIPRALFEPPIEHLQEWGYCWDTPANADNCFNYPETNRTKPYDTLQFLSGTAASFLAKQMYDDGKYVDGRFAPGERIVILVYNSVAGDKWGPGGGGKSDAAAVIGYFGALIVDYGNNMEYPCTVGSPGNPESYRACVVGQENTVYGRTSGDAPLVKDPTELLQEFLPKKVTLIK